MWIQATLQAHRMKTLEYEYPRFLRIYRAGVAG